MWALGVGARLWWLVAVDAVRVGGGHGWIVPTPVAAGPGANVTTDDAVGFAGGPPVTPAIGRTIPGAQTADGLLRRWPGTFGPGGGPSGR